MIRAFLAVELTEEIKNGHVCDPVQGIKGDKAMNNYEVANHFLP